MLSIEQIEGLLVESEAALLANEYRPNLRTQVIGRFWKVNDANDARQVRAYLDAHTSVKNKRAARRYVVDPEVGGGEKEPGKWWAAKNTLTKSGQPKGVYQELVLTRSIAAATDLTNPIKTYSHNVIEPLSRLRMQVESYDYVYPSIDPDSEATIRTFMASNGAELVSIVPAGFSYSTASLPESQETGLPYLQVSFVKVTAKAAFNETYSSVATQASYIAHQGEFVKTSVSRKFNQKNIPDAALGETLSGGLNELTKLYDYDASTRTPAAGLIGVSDYDELSWLYGENFYTPVYFKGVIIGQNAWHWVHLTFVKYYATRAAALVGLAAKNAHSASQPQTLIDDPVSGLYVLTWGYSKVLAGEKPTMPAWVSDAITAHGIL